jgi:TolB-like protein/DNA-binding winged helix-turn-helix (wHTH) protein/Tfp pilus assembly protein PilF
MSIQTRAVFEFGWFRLNPAERLLLREKVPVPLPPKAFDALVVMVENRGRLLGKDELMRKVWPDTFVEESNLAQHISILRKALRDGEEGFQYIETVPRHGYRFIVEVRELGGVAPGIDALSGSTHIEIEAADSASWWRKTQYHIAAVVVVGLLILVGHIAHQRFALRAQPSGEKVMLAVLPFLNYSGDASQEYFNDGFTEEMITQLGSADPQHLGVIARTSAMKYKNTGKDMQEIGRELGVDYVLEGSVRRAGDRVRISAQLIQVRDQTHLWAQSYERDERDTLALETVVANALAVQVERTLWSSRPVAPLTNVRSANPEAYDLYLKGRYYWNERTQVGFWKGIEFFKQAIEKDPSYAPAYAGLADCYILLGPNDILPAKEVYPLAKGAALKALQFDDALAEAHASLGFVTLLYDWNPAQAEKEFRRAIELDPNYSTAHHWYAYDLAALKRSDEAVAEILRALELDPLSSIINTDVGQILFFAGRTDEAIAQCQKTIALDPQFNQVYWYLGLLYEQKGMFDQAFDAFLKATPGPSDSPQGAATRAAYRASGIKGYWRERLAMLDRQSKKQYISPFTFAVSYAQVGERDRALENLEKAFDERYPSMVFVPIEPVFASLRSDPRFAGLLHRISPV